MFDMRAQAGDLFFDVTALRQQRGFLQYAIAIESSANNKTAASERDQAPLAPVSVDKEEWQQALRARVRAAETDATRPANRFELEQRARGRRRRALESWPAERALPPSWMLEELRHPRYVAAITTDASAASEPGPEI